MPRELDGAHYCLSPARREAVELSLSARAWLWVLVDRHVLFFLRLVIPSRAFFAFARLAQFFILSRRTLHRAVRNVVMVWTVDALRICPKVTVSRFIVVFARRTNLACSLATLVIIAKVVATRLAKSVTITSSSIIEAAFPAQLALCRT